MWVGTNPISLPDAQIVSNTTLTTTGTQSSIDTTNYASFVLQLSGTGQFDLTIEGSNDGNYWQTLNTFDIDELAINDNINQNGLYVFKASSRFVRYNIGVLNGTVQAVLLGRMGPGPSAADELSRALDDTDNVQLNVKVKNGPILDKNGFIVASDNAGPYNFLSQNATSPLTIDTTGYSTIVVHQTTAGITTPTVSNDGINFVGILGTSVTTGTATAATIPAAGIYIFPAIARYFRLTGPASSVVSTIYLRVGQYNPNIGIINPPTNLTQVNGTAVVTGGVAGIAAVGGNIAAGVAPTANPLLVAGIGTDGLTRRILTDPAGRIYIATVDQANTVRTLPVMSTSYQNLPALTTAEVSQHEGSSLVQILAQILLELQINNFYVSQLPWMLQTGQIFSDEPTVFRQEPSLFNL